MCRRLKLLHTLEEYWDDKADDIDGEVIAHPPSLGRGLSFLLTFSCRTQLFGVRVHVKKERLIARYHIPLDRSFWKGGRVSVAMSCTWPMHVPKQTLQ